MKCPSAVSLSTGAADPKAGAVESVSRILDEERLNHRVKASGGILADAIK
jgi:tRNA(adenine34) deaminase